MVALLSAVSLPCRVTVAEGKRTIPPRMAPHRWLLRSKWCAFLQQVGTAPVNAAPAALPGRYHSAGAAVAVLKRMHPVKTLRSTK